jgi:hypothetical protein
MNRLEPEGRFHKRFTPRHADHPNAKQKKYSAASVSRRPISLDFEPLGAAQSDRKPSQTVAKCRQSDHNNNRLPRLLFHERDTHRISRPAMRLSFSLLIVALAVGPVAAQQPDKKTDKSSRRSARSATPTAPTRTACRSTRAKTCCGRRPRCPASRPRATSSSA